MGDDERRPVGLAQQLLELRPDLSAGVSVEGGQRLVEQQHGRIGGKGARERDSLALAAGQLSRLRVGERCQAEPLQQGDPSLPAELHVFADGQVGEERVLLKHEAHRPFLGREREPALRVEPGVPVDGDPAARRLKPGDRPEQRRLPRAGGPDERDDLAADRELYAEGELAERNVERETERVHPGISLSASRRVAPKTTKSAPIARAVSRSTSNWA